MAKTFDFNALEQPTLEVTMQDDKRTVLHLCTPTVELLERFQAAAKDVRIIAKKKDGQTIQALYELMADLFSCNADGVTVTAEELRDKYRLSLVHFVKRFLIITDGCTFILSARSLIVIFSGRVIVLISFGSSLGFCCGGVGFFLPPFFSRLTKFS